MPVEAIELQRINQNIKVLAKIKGLKVGDLETEIGFSAGYTSRIIPKEDYKPTNSFLDFVKLMSQKLGVSIDSLINFDFESASSDEMKLQRFLEDFYYRTLKCDFEWQYQDPNNIKNEFDIIRYKSHSLKPFMYTKDNRIIFKSQKYSNVKIASGIYSAQLNDDAKIYFVQLISDSEQTNTFLGYEMYISNIIYSDYSEDDYEENISCFAWGDNFHSTRFYNLLDKCFHAAYEAMKHIKLSSFASSFIDDYFKPRGKVSIERKTDCDSNDSIPF